MKYVIVPPPVTLLDREGAPLKKPDGKQLPTVTLHSFLMDVPCSDPKIGQGAVGLRRINKLDKLFADAKPDAEVAVEDADHAVVQEILAGITWNNLVLARQQLCFLDAWEKASEEKRPLKAVAEEASA